jgi:outer membrane protein TolC
MMQWRTVMQCRTMTQFRTMMQGRTVFWVVMGLVLLGGPRLAQAAEVLDAAAAAAAARERSPAVAAARGELVRLGGQREAACGIQSDPTVQASAAVVGEMWSVAVLQPLSLSGEGAAACRAAGHAQDAARSRLVRAELEVAAAARRAWVGAVAAEGQQALAARGLEVAERIAAAARARAAVGEASQLDLRLAVLQVEQARTGWLAARVAAGQQRAALAVLVGEEALPEGAQGLAIDPLDGAPPLQSAGPAARSDVVAAQAQVAAAEAELRRQRARTLPPVAIGAFVEEEGPELRVGPRVSLTLPLWRGNVDGRAAAEAALESARSQAAATRQAAAVQHRISTDLGAELEAALAAQPADLPEQARAGLDSVALGYDRGELDLLTAALLQGELLAGHRAWLEGRRVVAEARIAGLLAAEDRRLLGGAEP